MNMNHIKRALTTAMLAMMSTGTSLCFAQPAGPRTPERTGTLTAPAKFPIIVNGKPAPSDAMRGIGIELKVFCTV